MAATRRKTEDVLSTARKDLQAQLAVVREEIGRLAAEERALTQALSNLDGDSASSSTTAPAANVADSTRTAKRSASTGRARKRSTSRRRRRGSSKSTADRVNELQWLLADGPKSRNDLAAALGAEAPAGQGAEHDAEEDRHVPSFDDERGAAPRDRQARSFGA